MAAVVESSPFVFDSAHLDRKAEVPPEFVLPQEDRSVFEAEEVISLPIIDLQAFFAGDPAAANVPQLVREACERHGFFLVSNHGVKPELISEVHRSVDAFFSLPLPEKQKALRRAGEGYGYATSYIGRFAENLPWKETLSFRHCGVQESKALIRDYMVSSMGEDFGHNGNVFQEYSWEMTRVALEVLEMMGESLGIGRRPLKEFYEDHDSILRLNYYPPCQNPGLVLGTGPHCDPTSLTVLLQDDVVGLQVHVDGRWRTVLPIPGTFIINIGDTLSALTNGRCKSSLHRAAANAERRRTVALFVNPQMDKVVTPPEGLVDSDHPRKYPDFKWASLMEFTHKHYRADMNTLDAFFKWDQKNSEEENSS